MVIHTSVHPHQKEKKDHLYSGEGMTSVNWVFWIIYANVSRNKACRIFAAATQEPELKLKDWMEPANRKKLNCPHSSFFCEEEICCKQRTWNRVCAGRTVGLIQQSRGGTRQLHQSRGRQSATSISRPKAFPMFYEEGICCCTVAPRGKSSCCDNNMPKKDAGARITRIWEENVRSTKLLRTELRTVYKEKLSHRNALTHKSFYTQELLHRKVSTRREKMHTHRRFCTQTLLHRAAFTQKPLHNSYTEKTLYTQKLLDRACCTLAGCRNPFNTHTQRLHTQDQRSFATLDQYWARMFCRLTIISCERSKTHNPRRCLRQHKKCRITPHVLVSDVHDLRRGQNKFVFLPRVWCCQTPKRR